MTRKTAVFRVGLASTLAALVSAGAAQASVRLRGVDASAYPTIAATVVASGGGTPVLAENGVPVVGLRAVNLGAAKSVVLAIDRSRSMAGPSLADALAAAQSFVGLKRPADRVALVAFGRRAVRLTGFSTSSDDADAALRSIVVDDRQGTALYDGVTLSARALASQEGGRVLVVLTDGRDVSSSASLDAAVKAARAAGVSVYTVAIQGADFTPAPLRTLASQTGGGYYRTTSSSALGGIYAQIAKELRHTWRVQYATSARPGAQLRLQASVVGAGSAESTLTVPGRAASTSPAPSKLLPVALYGAVGPLLLAVAVGLLVLLSLALLLAAKRGSWVRGRLAPHLGERRPRGATRKEGLQALAALYRATESAFGHLKQWRSLARMLERSEVPLRTVEFVWVMVGCGLGLGMLAAVSGRGPLTILVAMGVGTAAPYCFVSFKVRRRARAFEDQLPDLLVTIAAALKAGHSFKQGLQAVVDEAVPPASNEFKRVLTETGLGRPMDDALAQMAERAGSKNFEFAITAVTIQRQVGGSLATLFDMVADTVRQRQQFARKIRSLTAMGRMSAYVLLGLPFFLAAAITVLNPGYMAPLFHSRIGHLLLFGGFIGMGFGALLLKKIVSFRG